MFSSIESTPLPSGALLEVYQRPDCYVDCFSVSCTSGVAHSRWLEAFLGSRVFRLERAVLRTLARADSSDGAVAALVAGDAESFAVWTVEHRTPQELLLRDRSARTRTWWRTQPEAHGVRLYFGSALVPKARAEEGEAAGTIDGWRWSIPLHRAYSRFLVSSACARLQAFS
ncbi:MAG: hypothetical protein AAF184_12075 [Pseudomonadota bacterium]